MCFLASYPNCNLSSYILLTKISMWFNWRSYVSLPLLKALLYNVVVLSWSVLSGLQSTHTQTPGESLLKPGNRTRGEMASWEGGSTLHPHLSLLPPLSHCRGSILHLLCTCVSHCTRQSIRCVLLGSRSVTMGTLSWVLWWPSLKTSNGIKTQHGCSDTLCVSWRFVDLGTLWEKGLCWMTFDDWGDGERLQFN